LYTKEEIEALAKLPNREGLLSMLLSVLQAPVRNTALAIKAVAEQKDGAVPRWAEVRAACCGCGRHGTLQRRVGAAREPADRAGDSQPRRLDQTCAGRGRQGGCSWWWGRREYRVIPERVI